MTIRRATVDDTAFVVSLCPSFVAFGLPGGRDPEAHVAEEAGRPLGFGDIAVAGAAQGRGVGRELIVLSKPC